jgi:hypothetical protein
MTAQAFTGAMRTTTTPSLSTVPDVRFGGAVGLLFAATAVCQHLVPTADGGLVLATIVALTSLTLPARYAVGLAASAWALLTGFFVNVGGQLTFSSDDVRRALVLVVVATVAATLGKVSAHRGTRTSSRPWMHSIRSSLPGPIESPSSCRGVSTAARTTTVRPVIRWTSSSLRERRASTR